MNTREILIRAKEVRSDVSELSSDKKNVILKEMAREISNAKEKILAANEIDMKNARKTINETLLDRLKLNNERIDGMILGLENLIKLPDPIGIILEERTLYNGISMKKISVPMGVVAIIYESRPNVTSDVAGICLKSGNVAILRGGKEAYNTSFALVEAMREALKNCGAERDFLQLIEDTSRKSSEELMEAQGYVDLLIPRGGAKLIEKVSQYAKVPVIKTGSGICSVYVDEYADIEKALRIVKNAKTSRPSVCNAEETLLVHKDIAEEFLPKLKNLLDNGEHPVELRVDERACKIIAGVPATEEDFHTEFLDYILAVKIVENAEDACEHIATHGTGHSEAIITENKDTAKFFTSRVDSATVYVNASTRFTDGGEFGLGCEIGISTQKLHARGPMGLEALTSYKYILEGTGQIRG